MWWRISIRSGRNFPLVDENDDPVKDADDKEVEVLVNYMPEGKLKPQIFIKGNITEDRREFMEKLAQAIVNHKLEQKEGVKGKEKLKFGTMVYVKSTVTAPTLKPFMVGKKKEKPETSLVQKAVNYVVSFFKPIEREEPDYTYDTYKYKVYHPAFPHESTADQFFDPVQWESYYQLGQFIGADVLNVKASKLMSIRAKQETPLPTSLADWIKYFDKIGVPDVAPAFVRAKKSKSILDDIPTEPVVTVETQTEEGKDGEEHVGYSM